MKRLTIDRLQVWRGTLDILSSSACTHVSLTTKRKGSIQVLSSVVQDVIDFARTEIVKRKREGGRDG